MKAKISNEEIHCIDKVWHKLIDSMQKTNAELWKDRLEDITTIEISILSLIERRPDVILKEIVKTLGVPGSTLTSAIDRLEKRGLLKRIISSRDRRSFGLELTEEGKIAQQEHYESEGKLWKKVLGAYETSDERKELIRLLEILADNLNKEDGKHDEE